MVGNRTRVTVKKNKVAPPFRTAEFDIMYNEGISTAGDLLDLGVEYDILSKRGAYYRFNEEIIGQGREASKEFLRQNARAGCRNRPPDAHEGRGCPCATAPAATGSRLPAYDSIGCDGLHDRQIGWTASSGAVCG